MIIIRDKKERERFIKFVVVGTIGFGVDSGTYNLVRSGFGTSPEISSNVLRRLLLASATAAAVVGVLSALRLLIGDQFLPPKVIGENLSLAIVVIIVMFWNFFVNRFWTYNDVK